MYLHGKQTIAQISETTGLSASTITRRLAFVSLNWDQPKVGGCGVVHLDATYFGRNIGVLLALESGTGRLLYMKHIAHEHISDYEEAVRHIVGCGYLIHGIVIDGLQKLFVVFAEYRIQMCQFHMVAIVRRKLTKNPQLEAGKELLELAYRLKGMDKDTFVSEFERWKKKWHDFLKEKTVNEVTGHTVYTHQRLRSAMVSISTYLPFLFTYEDVDGMPNTNNMIEGTFTDMKKTLRNHPGMIEDNRKRMVNGFSWHMQNHIIQRETTSKAISRIALCVFDGIIPRGVAPQQSSVALQAAMQNNRIYVKQPKTGVTFSTRFDL